MPIEGGAGGLGGVEETDARMPGRPRLDHVLTAILTGAPRSPGRRDALRATQLRRVLAHAYHRVPFYRALFDRHGIRPGDIHTVSDLAVVPLTSKAELSAVPVGDRLADGADRARLITRSTSGSDGRPFTIHRTWLEQTVLGAFRARVQVQLGLKPTDRVVSFGALRPPHPADSRVLGRALHALGVYRRWRLDAFRDVDALVDEARRLRPDVLSGYPSVLARIAENLHIHAFRDLRPRLLFSGGEVLSPVLRRTIEEGFNAPVFDLYGCHEFNLVAWQCPQGSALHTCDDAHIVEVLHGDRPAREGESGEVVVTSLYSYAMPLIRYRLGDTAVRGATPCACGRHLGTIQEIEGRVFERLMLPGGRVINPHFIGRLLIAEPGIIRYQVIQDRQESVGIRLVLRAGAELDRERLAAAIQPILGPAVDLQFVVVPDISSDSTGKFRVYRGPMAAGEADDADTGREQGASAPSLGG
jgi:phenylacetate-CoA ligase